MTKMLTIDEGKAKFTRCLRSAEAGDAVVFTRRGKPVAALVSAAELAQLERLRAAGPEAGLAGLAGGWEGSEGLVTEIAKVRRGRWRRVPRFK
jgi:prevent-host-death family protein